MHQAKGKGRSRLCLKLLYKRKYKLSKLSKVRPGFEERRGNKGRERERIIMLPDLALIVAKILK